MYTATPLRLTRSWFVNAQNQTDFIVCGTVRPSERTDNQDGGIRQYATGQRQAFNTPSSSTMIPIQLVGLSFKDFRKVTKLWIPKGVTLLWRSAQGEREFVNLFEATTSPFLITSMNDGRGFNVSVTLYAVDYNEAV